MAKKATEILRKFPDYRAIPYASDLCCPQGDMKFMVDKPNLVGWCETNNGYMMVLECPKCFTRYRYHATDHWDDTIDEFNESLIDKLYDDYMLQYKTIVHFMNGVELFNQLEIK